MTKGRYYLQVLPACSCASGTFFKTAPTWCILMYNDVISQRVSSDFGLVNFATFSWKGWHWLTMTITWCVMMQEDGRSSSSRSNPSETEAACNEQMRLTWTFQGDAHRLTHYFSVKTRVASLWSIQGTGMEFPRRHRLVGGFNYF